MLWVLVAIVLLSSLLPPTRTVHAYSNGGLSDDPSSPKYGTHDWFAEHAIDSLPPEEKTYLTQFMSAYLFGTEIPDANKTMGGLNDKTFHHVFYRKNETLHDDVGARRAWSEFNRTINYLNYSEAELAAFHAGVMTHYLADVTIFAHVMGSKSEWGAEVGKYHSGYEAYVNRRTSSYDSVFNDILTFDGELTELDAYEATLRIAFNTTFGDSGPTMSAEWMNSNYNWSDPIFHASADASIDRGVNLLADALHTIYVRHSPGSGMEVDHVAISEVFYDTPGNDNVEEYLELYNPLSNEVDIGGWKVEDPGRTYTIPENVLIAPNSFFVVARDASGFRELFEKDPDHEGLTIQMGNNGDQISLLDQDGLLVDFVAWENNVAGWDIKADKNRSLIREPVFLNSDTSADWRSNRPPNPTTERESPPPQPEPILNGAGSVILGSTAALAVALLYYLFARRRTR